MENQVEKMEIKGNEVKTITLFLKQDRIITGTFVENNNYKNS